MVQVLTPDGVITQGSWTGSFTAIDEATASDSDFVWSADNPGGDVFEVSLSNPAATPGAGDLLVPYRHGQTDGGILSGSGSATTLDVALMQGGTTIASDAQQAPGGAWTTRNWTIAAATAATITDWTDLRLRFTPNGGGGSPANRRGVGISWAQAQAQEGAVPPIEITPLTGSLVRTGYAPALAQSANQELTPLAGSISRAGYAPALSQSAGVEIVPLTGSLVRIGYVPALAQSANTYLTPITGSLFRTGYAPAVSRSANLTLQPMTGALRRIGWQPAVTQQGPGGGSFAWDKRRTRCWRRGLHL